MNSLVSTNWLADHLGADGMVLLDSSRHLPAAGRDPLAEYEAQHIPGAYFLGLSSLTDPDSPVPAALPNASQLAQRLAELGINPGARIVLYDDSAVKSAARAWFTLMAHGRTNVAILDGGFAKWRAESRALESGLPALSPTVPTKLQSAIRVATKANMLANMHSTGDQVLDARGADRVYGVGIDPVHGGQNGRIPGALNLPFGSVFAQDGTFKSPKELRAAFMAAGIDMDKPIVTTCGSGLTASVLLFALHLTGKHDVQLYDGSWLEWSADPDTPKAQGPA